MTYSINIYRLENTLVQQEDLIVCPKCGFTSGNDWSQCENNCPMQQSPHYDGLVLRAFEQEHLL